MNPSNFKSVVMEILASSSSSSDEFSTVDTKGFDYMVMDVYHGTHEAAETALEILRVGESDTAPTDVTTDCDVLPAFSCAAAACATADNVLPAASSTKLNIDRINMDLRGRKRYIAIDWTPVKQTVDGWAVVAHLFRNNMGDDPVETQATTADGFRIIMSG